MIDHAPKIDVQGVRGILLKVTRKKILVLMYQVMRILIVRVESKDLRLRRACFYCLNALPKGLTSIFAFIS
jgi:hypothetical protein